jgi:hypothetical protein
MTQHVLRGISVKAMPVANPKESCEGCVFTHADAPGCPLKFEELKAGFEDACYNTNVIYVEDKK